MLGSATQAAVESGGADAAAESGGNGSGWVNIPLQPWVAGQPPVEKDGEDAYVPTAEEVAAAAADSAGENEVEVGVEVDEEGVGETSVGRGARSARGRGRRMGRAGRVQGRSSEGATEAHGSRRTGGTSRGGRGGGRVSRVAQGGGDARVKGSAPVEDGPSRADTQRNDGVGGTPLRAGGTSRGGGTSGGRQRRTKRQREVTPTDPFRRFVKLLNPGAERLLGTRYRLARDMQAYADAAREELKQELIGDGLAGRLSLSTDIWTSENNLAFMVVTVHRITKDFQLRQHILDFVQLEGSHTASLIAKTLEGILAEWGLTEMLFAVTTDNAENNNKAMRMLAGDPAEGAMARIEFPLFHGDRHVRCIAHVMNIAVQAALKKDVVTEALKRLRAVCSYVGWSVQRSENFARQQRILQRRDDAPVLRLIGDSPTRWGSTYDMIVRALELQQALALLLMRTDVSGGGNERGVTAAMGWLIREQLDGLRLSDVHWDALVELKDRAELLDKLEISFRKEGVTPLRQALITAALDKLKKYKYREKEELVVATFLDPRYKTVFFQLPKWEARNAAHVTEVGGCARMVQDVDEGTVIRLVRARMAEYQARVSSRRQGGEVTSDIGGATGPSSVTGGASGTTGAGGGGGGGFEHSIFDEMDALEAAAGGGAQDEVDRYLAEPRQRGGCLLAFWRAREDFTVLREMARDYLAVPATSAASERAFSQGRNIITWQRHRLTAGRVRAVMAIKSWMEQNTSSRSLNIAGAARVLEDLCYEGEGDGF
ncbi:unnamed protein product [Closterium sp. Naga37s-1]|nr:unnamed protein product [Closterium sp. Naga37s-1]